MGVSNILDLCQVHRIDPSWWKWVLNLPRTSVAWKIGVYIYTLGENVKNFAKIHIILQSSIKTQVLDDGVFELQM